MKKKIIVCGSIGYGGIDTIKEIRDFLRENYFNIIDHIEKEDMDYSDIGDFRDDKSLSEKIVKHDLEYIDQADIIVVITERPSFGTAIEQYHAYSKKKEVVLFSEKPVPTPWPIHFSTYIAKSKEELLEILNKL